MEAGPPHPARARSSARVAGALVALGGVLLVAGCGGSGATAGEAAGTGTNASNQQAVAASACMRANGIRNFPDPVKGPGGVGLSVSASPGNATVTVGGIPFTGPAFTAAAKTCRFGPGGKAHGGLSAARRRGMLQNAACMRSHGVPNFPDPTFGPRGGVRNTARAGIDINAPAFVRANHVCNSVGVPLPGGG